MGKYHTKFNDHCMWNKRIEGELVDVNVRRKIFKKSRLTIVLKPPTDEDPETAWAYMNDLDKAFFGDTVEFLGGCMSSEMSTMPIELTGWKIIGMIVDVHCTAEKPRDLIIGLDLPTGKNSRAYLDDFRNKFLGKMIWFSVKLYPPKKQGGKKVK